MNVASPQVINAKYCASAVRTDQYPAGEWPEVAFIGRSNVGKSSLINSLCRHGGLARISATPGKTQTINFYNVTLKYDETERRQFFLVDLPGYGYAKAARQSRRQWTRFIDEYLAASPRLRLVCLLIDIRHPPQANDIEAFQRLAELGARVQLIATKADKISRMMVNRQVEQVRKGLGLSAEAGKKIIAYSAETGTGRMDLLDVISTILLE